MYSHLQHLLGLVYLRFSGLIFHENGKLVWKSPEKGWSFGRLMPWAGRDPSTTSFHVSGESGSNGTRAPNPEQNGVGKHLKTIARRLMLYPFGELLLLFKASYLGIDGSMYGSVFDRHRSGCDLPLGHNGRLDTSIPALYIRWGKKPSTVPSNGRLTALYISDCFHMLRLVVWR